MDLNKLRKKNCKQINFELTGYLKEQFHLRMKKVSRKLNKTHLLRIVKKKIARIKTILREKKV